MTQWSQDAVDRVFAPPLVPGDRPIDLNHLSRMTLGDPMLECEVLRLFECQAAMLMNRMDPEHPPHVAAAAHTLKGSAAAIGAWSVARTASAVEAAAMSGDKSAVEGGLTGLTAAVREARSDIAAILRG